MTKTSTSAKWRSRVAEWRASGESAEAFAAGKGFAGSSLRWWSSRLGREEIGAAASRAGSIAMARVVRMPSAPRETAEVTIAIGAARVVVGRGFDAGLLREVVAALESAS